MIIGKSNCGKTTLLLNLLLQPGWLDYNHLYVFGKSLHQQEYQILKKGFEKGLSKIQISNIFKNQDEFSDPTELIEAYSGPATGEIKAEFYDDCKLVPDPTTLNEEEKNLLVLDDCLLEKQNKAEAFYTCGRHKIVIVFISLKIISDYHGQLFVKIQISSSYFHKTLKILIIFTLTIVLIFH